MLRLQPIAGESTSRRGFKGNAFGRLPCKTAHPTGEWGGQCRGAGLAGGGDGDEGAAARRGRKKAGKGKGKRAAKRTKRLLSV